MEILYISFFFPDKFEKAILINSWHILIFYIYFLYNILLCKLAGWQYSIFTKLFSRHWEVYLSDLHRMLPRLHGKVIWFSFRYKIPYSHSQSQSHMHTNQIMQWRRHGLCTGICVGVKLSFITYTCTRNHTETANRDYAIQFHMSAVSSQALISPSVSICLPVTIGCPGLCWWRSITQQRFTTWLLN